MAFRGAMNLYAVLTDLGDDPTSAEVIDAFRGAKERKSFDGYPYTCDGKQIPELPSLCASQEVLVSIAADGQTFSEESDGWIDVPKLVAEYLR